MGVLRNTNSAYEEALLSGDVPRRQKEDLAFHMGITELSGSRALSDIMERFHLAAKTFLLAETDSRAIPLPGKRIDPVETHTNIIAAIESGNPETAEKSMREHIAHVKARFEERYIEELKKG
jgi:DNA-binding GntR family transcriptional regulator